MWLPEAKFQKTRGPSDQFDPERHHALRTFCPVLRDLRREKRGDPSGRREFHPLHRFGRSTISRRLLECSNFSENGMPWRQSRWVLKPLIAVAVSRQSAASIHEFLAEPACLLRVGWMDRSTCDSVYFSVARLLCLETVCLETVVFETVVFETVVFEKRELKTA